LKLPDSVESRFGIFLALLGVAYNSLIDGRLIPRESVAVFGSGVVGLLCIQLCRLAGAEQIFSIDPAESRRKIAKLFGASHVFDPAETADLSLRIRDLTEGRGADLAIEASGAHPALQESIRCVGYNGRVVVVCFMMGGADAHRASSNSFLELESNDYSYQ
jgi:threonine dehydrogenase-like Zn-dependent dehydrogenase